METRRQSEGKQGAKETGAQGDRYGRWETGIRQTERKGDRQVDRRMGDRRKGDKETSDRVTR